MSSRTDTVIAHALDTLCDLGLTPREAVERYARATKWMTPGARSFALFVGGTCRVARMYSAYDEAQSLRWADDGGRMP